ncbi:DsbC family protein [Sphingobium yanoikuyae]|uniref:Thiol:disulfide interchange protein n=1 Tax=Sphingobium yanoikuyae TaxID=13690 RepID=A0A291MZM2_SPHYA|nr:DsbC family protein [Sphingobium yanoikuyae]ATI80552.1 disulfide bond formation protein DsbC [Sphingobium yanoikuyae]
MSAIDRLRRAARSSRMAIATLLGLGIAGIALAADTNGLEDQVRGLLERRLPRTQITAIDCQKIAGLCEVTAGSNLFYVDGGGRYLVIGRVYDMQTRQDITAARLLEMNPDMLVGAAALANAAANAGALETGEAEELAAAPPARAERVTRPVRPVRLSLAELPKDGAIVWGNPAGQTVTVFTDLRCGYCRALTSVLKDMHVRVVERPISVLGSRDLADRVYCARDRAAALHAAYAGEALKNRASCDTSGLDANEAFAHRHGLRGTPVIVREDGAMLEGYRPRAFLEEWLQGGRS